MRVVLDHNVVVSAMLWGGAPKQVLELAEDGKVEVFSSTDLLAELYEILSRPKFQSRFVRAGVTPARAVARFAAVTTLVTPNALPSVVVTADPDDDAILACAMVARAEAIISGDQHLLALKSFQGITILSAAGFLARHQDASSPPSTSSPHI